MNIIKKIIESTLELSIYYIINYRYELIGNKDQAMDFYQQLLNFVPSDPSLLVKLSDIADAENDKQQSLSYLTDVSSF